MLSFIDIRISNHVIIEKALLINEEALVRNHTDKNVVNKKRNLKATADECVILA